LVQLLGAPASIFRAAVVWRQGLHVGRYVERRSENGLVIEHNEIRRWQWSWRCSAVVLLCRTVGLVACEKIPRPRCAPDQSVWESVQRSCASLVNKPAGHQESSKHAGPASARIIEIRLRSTQPLDFPCPPYLMSNGPLKTIPRAVAVWYPMPIVSDLEVVSSQPYLPDWIQRKLAWGLHNKTASASFESSGE